MLENEWIKPIRKGKEKWFEKVDDFERKKFKVIF